MAKIIAVIRDRANGDAVASEDVNFRNPALTILDTDTTGADGSATYLANANPAGLISWDASVSGETRKAGARAQRQIGPLFEAELAKSFKGIMSNGYSEGDGSECAVIPGSGRQVTVGTGCLWVQGIPFHFYSTTNLSSSANPGTFATRLDRVILRVKLDDSATDYGMGTLVYLEGTVNNTLPSITQSESGTYEYILANVTSASGFSSYTAGNISDQRAQSGPNAVGSVVQTALDLKANLASPTFTGTVTLPTVTVGGTITANAVAITPTELGYIGTLTSDAQTQLSAKANTVSPTFTGTPVLPGYSLTGNISTDSKTVTPANLGYLMNASSELQAQINAKAATASPTFTGTVTAANLTVTGAMNFGDTTADDLTLIGSLRSEKTSNPSVTVNTSVGGTGASAGISGTDMAGIITLTVATANGATTGKIMDVDFAQTKPDGGFAPVCWPLSAAASLISARVYTTSRDTAGWDLQLQTGGGSALPTGTYIWSYIVIEYES